MDNENVNGNRNGTAKHVPKALSLAQRRMFAIDLLVEQDLTMGELNERLVNAGYNVISKSSYIAFQREALIARGPETVNVMTPKERVIAESLVERAKSLTEADHLSEFVKFAIAVETVGGVTKARKMLDVMESLFQTQGDY